MEKLSRTNMEITLAIIAFLTPPILAVGIPVGYYARHNYGRLAARGEVRRALFKAARNRRWKWINNYINSQLALPDSSLRPLLSKTARRLIDLQTALGPENPLPAPLRETAQTQINAAFDALFHACARLSIVGKQRIHAESLRPEIALEAANLQQLLEATEAASVELARLTMLSHRDKAPAVSAQFGQLGWAARELRRLEI